LTRKKKKHIPYPDYLSSEIENQWATHHGGIVKANGGKTEIDINKKEEVHHSEGLFKSKEKKEIIRGTWFWLDDDNKTWRPYPDNVALYLEQCFKSGQISVPGGRCELPGEKKVRYIQMESDGTYRQRRVKSDANPEGRKVLRGFMGQVLEVDKV